MARNRMLECGKNYKGTMAETCQMCLVTDDENHRMNDCISWREINNVDKSHRASFSDVFSSEYATLNNAIREIQSIWELHNGNGRMKKPC